MLELDASVVDVSLAPVLSGPDPASPPLLVDDPSALAAGEGIDASLLATAEHPAGGTQVTYGGWPLYYFAGDAAPGDTNGQGSGDVWFALDAAGQPIP